MEENVRNSLWRKPSPKPRLFHIGSLGIQENQEFD